MRFAKVMGAAVLISASPAALACDMDGYGGHRYFAFANMVGGASPDQIAPSPRPSYSPPADTTAPQPKLRDAHPADKQSTERTDTESTDSASAPQTSSADQGSVTDDRPSDGAVFR